MIHGVLPHSHIFILKKDIARRTNTNKSDIFLRARTVGADLGTSTVTTRALIIESVAHKSKAIKAACMENLAPTCTNRASDNQVFVPFGTIEGVNNKKRKSGYDNKRIS